MHQNQIDGQVDSFGGKELPAGTRLEEFVIEQVLGSGGFGITYLARDTSLNRQVVIKENLPAQFAHRDTTSLTIRPGPGREDQENFQWSLDNFSREAEMLASLHHPGIVPVLRRFEAFGTAYFVMPFVEGVPFDGLIEDRISNNKPFTEEELRGLLERTLSALDHLHQRGIYHRDIKPANILISNDGIPVLIDFGSARQRLSERSMTVVESAGYTPFEQLESRGNVGPWSDLYALGGTIEKALTGQAPPKAMDRMRRDPRVPLVKRDDLKWAYSHQFLESLDKALEVDESLRWQTHLPKHCWRGQIGWERTVTLCRNPFWVSTQDRLDLYQKHLSLIPDSPRRAEFEKRIIDLEVAEITRGDHGKLPPAAPVKMTGGNEAQVKIENQTRYTLTVRYSGKQSYRFDLNPDAIREVNLATGTYQVAATVSSPGVIPYAGSDTLHGGLYSSKFYIETRRR